MVTESNPFWWPLYFPSAIVAFVAGCLPKRPKVFAVAQLCLLAVAAARFHVVLARSVDWSYTHPFNPDDGGPRTFAALFGWLEGLVWPILPVFIITRFLIHLSAFLFFRYRGQSGATQAVEHRPSWLGVLTFALALAIMVVALRS